MTTLVAAAIFLAGFLAGVTNAIAGGGTFLTFGALTLAGVPPIMANTTSSLTQFPGYVTSSLAYRDEIRRRWRAALALCVVSAVGAIVGAVVLLRLDNTSFRAMVPWLLLAATLLFAAGPWLKAKAGQGAQTRRGPVSGMLVQFVTAIYGGFFGAGMGVMMLATLGLTQAGNYHQLNALKNLLSIVIAAVAILVFVLGGAIAWLYAIVMIPAVGLGGYAGIWMAKRLPEATVRAVVVMIGLLLAGYYFWIG